jgi:hypothetical protein
MDDKLVKELQDLKITDFTISSRFEALLRLLLTTKKIDYDGFTQAVTNIGTFNNTLRSLIKESNVVLKIEKATEYNKKNFFSIYADDLELQKVFELNGGASDYAARLSLELPCSNKYAEYIKQYIKQPYDGPVNDTLFRATDVSSVDTEQVLLLEEVEKEQFIDD